MKEARFVTKIQSHKRVAIPKTTYNTLDLQKGGTVEVTVKRIDKKKELEKN